MQCFSTEKYLFWYSQCCFETSQKSISLDDFSTLSTSRANKEVWPDDLNYSKIIWMIWWFELLNWISPVSTVIENTGGRDWELTFKMGVFCIWHYFWWVCCVCVTLILCDINLKWVTLTLMGVFCIWHQIWWVCCVCVTYYVTFT